MFKHVSQFQKSMIQISTMFVNFRKVTTIYSATQYKLKKSKMMKINGLLPVPPPVRLTLPIVHVHYDALKPPPLRLAPPTAHLPPAPHFPPLPPTPSSPPVPPGTPPVSQW